MKRLPLLLAVGCIALLFSAVAAAETVIGLDNGSFNVDLPPRQGYQGWEDEYIYGWKPFSGLSWMEYDPPRVSVVQRDDVPGGVALRLLGVETGYVGIRSHHIPVEPFEIYTVTAQAYVEEMLDPTRLQIWLEFWPENPEAENAANRLHYSRARTSMLRTWEDLSVSDMAPANAATATVLIIIHSLGNPAGLPAEGYVANVTFSVAE